MTTPDPITKARPRTDRLVASPYGLGSATTGARQHSQPSGKIPYQVKTDAKWGHFGPPRRGHCKLPLSAARAADRGAEATGASTPLTSHDKGPIRGAGFRSFADCWRAIRLHRRGFWLVGDSSGSR
jgi:hypothetical protein